MGKINVWWQKTFGRTGPDYLVTLSVGIDHAWGGGGHLFSAYPQAWAVVDDFGNLVTMGQFA